MLGEVWHGVNGGCFGEGDRLCCEGVAGLDAACDCFWIVFDLRNCTLLIVHTMNAQTRNHTPQLTTSESSLYRLIADRKQNL